jgi:hypothetical protein
LRGSYAFREQHCSGAPVIIGPYPEPDVSNGNRGSYNSFLNGNDYNSWFFLIMKFVKYKAACHFTAGVNIVIDISVGSYVQVRNGTE